MPYRNLSVAALLVVLTVPAVAAGEAEPASKCPPESRLTEPRQLVAPPDKGAVREVLSYAMLDGWRGVQGLALRIRRITVVPGGFVPLHWHNDRPSVDYIIEGELIEHNAMCAVPIVHRAGDSDSEFGEGVAHWWENKTDRNVVLVSADVVPIDKVHY